MIRGVQRQVVVVEPKESAYFEQAVFFVRVPVSHEPVSVRDLLDECERVSGCPVRPAHPRRSWLFGRFRPKH